MTDAFTTLDRNETMDDHDGTCAPMPGASPGEIHRMRQGLEQAAPRHEAIVARLCSCGYEAYITGGAVRDLLLGLDPLDFDVVTNAQPEEIAAVFQGERVEEVGRSFNVTLVNGVEVATYRQDVYHGGGHRDCSVSMVENLRQDLERRDLTFNSMAFCPYTGDLIDPYGGKADLARRLVRFVGDPRRRILEDPDRIVRACRFAANLDGRFEDQTLDALRDMAALTAKVAPERLRLEVKKALQIRQASRFFRNLHHVGILERLFPSLAECVGHDGGRHHGEDVFEHCLLVGDALASRCWLTKLAGYLHDVGKPGAAVLDDQGRPVSFIGHESIGGWLVERDLRALKFSSREIAFVANLIQVHMHDAGAASTPRAIRKLLAKLDAHRLDHLTFLRLRLADHKGNLAKPGKRLAEVRAFLEKMEAALFSKNRQQEFNRSMLAVNGTDLIQTFSLRPGKEVGRLLNILFEYVLDYPEHNDRQMLLAKAVDLLGRAREVTPGSPPGLPGFPEQRTGATPLP